MELEGFSGLEKIAEGGMAILFRGIQTSLNRPVAIKVLKGALSETPEAREMFEWESKIVARMDHPHIIRVIDKGLTHDGQPYFVMDYVEGHTLKEVIQSGKMPERRKLRIIIQVAKALAYAHKNGIIHRDIKPGNVLIDKEGNARVVDFGIARIFSEDTEIKQRSEEGLTLGTLSYMAPEQHEGAKYTTELSDIFSLGVIMYLMFTERLPKPGFPPPSHFNPKLPPALDRIIMLCLADSQADRPTAEQLISLLLKSAKGAHLKQEQKQAAKETFQDPKEKFRLLDIIKETPYSTVSLYENREDHSLMVLKKSVGNFAGYNEAELLSRLKHKNIVNIRGVTRNDRIFIIVMEYLSGGSLQGRLAQPMKPSVFLPLAHQICDALIFAHNNRIVHGNLRPQNILFDDANQAKLMDFGFCKHYEESADPNWYAPINGGPPTIATDVYSAGVIFYQLLTGQLPKLENGVLEPYESFKQLPDFVQKLIGNMLLSDPTQRPGNFEDIKQALGQGQQAPKPAKPKPAPKAAPAAPKKRSKAPLMALIAFLLISGNIGIYTWIAKQNGVSMAFLDRIPWLNELGSSSRTGPEKTETLAEKTKPAPSNQDEWVPRRAFNESNSREEEIQFEQVDTTTQ